MSGTPTTTTERGTVSQTSSSQPACTWPGHCLGDTCSDSTDCDRDWACVTGYCTVECAWPGHCIGDPCGTYNDCDQDWVCNNKKCAVCTDCDEGSAGSAATTLSTSTGSKTQTQPAESQSTSSSSSASLPSETTTRSNISTPVAIGIGVAIAVVVIAICSIIFLLWRLRRKRRAQEEQARRNGHGSSELDSQFRIEMRDRNSPVEIATGQVPQELDERGMVKHYYVPETQPRDPPPVEIDGREYQHGMGAYDLEDQILYGSHMSLGDREAQSRSVDGLDVHNTLRTPSSGISSPSRPPTSPGRPTGSVVSLTEGFHHQRPDGYFANEPGGQHRPDGDHRRRLRRKSGG